MASHQIYMDHVWDILVGVYPIFPLERYPIIISLSYYTINIVTGITLRRVVKNHVATRWQPYLLNAITAFQGLACSLENTQISRYYGMFAYWLTLTTISMISVITVKGSSSNPCAQMLQYAKGTITLKEMLLRIASQIVGGLLSYQYARQFWSLGLHPGHVMRYHRTTRCVSDLTVPLPFGFTIEFLLTMFDVVCGLLVITPYYLCESAVKLGISCYFVTLGLHLTGMYGNPLNATNQTFGCDGITAVEHFIVYWMGPLSATLIGYKLHHAVRESRLRSERALHKERNLVLANDDSEVKDKAKASKNGSEEKVELTKGHAGKVRVRRNASRAKRA